MQRSNRSLNLICPLVVFGVAGILFAPRDRVTKLASSPAETHLVCGKSPGQKIEPQAIAYLSDASREAEREAKQAAAQAAYDELIANRESRRWQNDRRLTEELARLGAIGLPFLLQGVEHPRWQIHWACCNQLKESFPEEPAFIDTMSRLLENKEEHHMLRSWAAEVVCEHQREHAADLLIRILENKDENVGIRRSAAFLLGTYKIERTADLLRKIGQDDEQLRLIAAKSLAELGDKKAARTLYMALDSNHYMERYYANLGFKALTGRDTADNGYQWHENAFVSGGNEYITVKSPIEDNRQMAARYQAIADYCKWLEAEQPEIYVEIFPPAGRRKALRTASRVRGGQNPPGR
jgi:HEAT repeat protein